MDTTLNIPGFQCECGHLNSTIDACIENTTVIKHCAKCGRMYLFSIEDMKKAEQLYENSKNKIGEAQHKRT